MIGVAADVYRGRMDSKYSNRGAAAYQAPKKVPTKDDYLREVAAEAKKQHLGGKEVQYILRTRYQKSASSELTLEEASDLAANFIQYAVTYINEMGMNEDDNKLMEGV